MRFALIGCGRISPNHIVAARNNGMQIAALCDLKEDHIQDKVLKFELGDEVKHYLDYKEMLDTEQPDLVAVATESGKHASIALDCIRAGCHVIIEKPIALSLKDADEIIQTAEDAHVKVCICHQNRFNKSVRKIREAIDKKRFGRLYYGTAHIRWARDYEYYHRASWRGTWEQDGGALMNQCIHDIDLLRWMMGDEILEVTGITDRLGHDYIEAEDLGMALIRFANGSYGMIEGTTDIYPGNLEETLCIFGEKGTVKAGGEAVNMIEEWRFSDYLDQPQEVIDECREAPPNIYGFGHSKLYQDMAEAIRDDRLPYVDGMAGKRALELVLGIYLSAATGEKVRFPLKECAAVQFKKRFDLE